MVHPGTDLKVHPKIYACFGLMGGFISRNPSGCNQKTEFYKRKNWMKHLTYNKLWEKRNTKKNCWWPSTHLGFRSKYNLKYYQPRVIGNRLVGNAVKMVRHPLIWLYTKTHWWCTDKTSRNMRMFGNILCHPCHFSYHWNTLHSLTNYFLGRLIILEGTLLIIKII